MSGQHDYIKDVQHSKLRTSSLKQTIERQAQVIEELNRLVYELKHRLGRHDNYNTLPSQQKGSKMYRHKEKKRRRRKEKEGRRSSKARKGQKGRDGAAGCQKPRGGQKGHKEMTCKPKPTKYETHTSDSCPGCGSGSLWITKTLKRNITKVLRTVKAVTTSHSINTCRCRSCGRDGIEPETGLPNNGSYDPSIND